MAAPAVPSASVASAPAPIMPAPLGWLLPDAPWRDAELLAFVRSWPAFGTQLPAQLWLPVLEGAHQALNLAAIKLRASGSNAIELVELEHELLLALCDARVREKILGARQSPMGVLAVAIDERYRAQRCTPGPSLDDGRSIDGMLAVTGHTTASAADVSALHAEEVASPLEVALAELESMLVEQVRSSRLHAAVRQAARLVCASRNLAESHERALAADIATHVPQLTVAQVLTIVSAVLGVRGRRRRTSILGALLASPELGRRSLTAQYALTRFAREFHRPSGSRVTGK